MSVLYRKIHRVTNRTLDKGIIQTFNTKFPSFYDLQWNSTSKEGSKAKTCILSRVDYCMTTDEVNSSYVFSFPNFLLNLSGFSFLSCVSSRCAYNFDVFALDLETNEWNLISEVRKDPYFFIILQSIWNAKQNLTQIPLKWFNVV